MLLSAAGAGVLEKHGDIWTQLCEKQQDIYGRSVFALQHSNWQLCLAGVGGMVVINRLGDAVEEMREAVRVLCDSAHDTVGGDRVCDECLVAGLAVMRVELDKC